MGGEFVFKREEEGEAHTNKGEGWRQQAISTVDWFTQRHRLVDPTLLGVALMKGVVGSNNNMIVLRRGSVEVCRETTQNSSESIARNKSSKLVTVL